MMSGSESVWVVNSRSYLWHRRTRVHESAGSTGEFGFVYKIEYLRTYRTIDNFDSQFKVIQVKKISQLVCHAITW